MAEDDELGYNFYTTDQNVKIEKFTFCEISCIPDDGAFQMVWSVDDVPPKYYSVTRGRGFAFPILIPMYKIVNVFPTGEISIFTDGKITLLV